MPICYGQIDREASNYTTASQRLTNDKKTILNLLPAFCLLTDILNASRSMQLKLT